MFNNEKGYVIDLPEPIQPFYVDELSSEPLLDENGEPVMKEEEYEYIDEEGNLVIGTRLVPEYHDVNYTVEKPRNDLKGWDFWKLAKKYEVKIYGIEKACEAEQWQFHDSYIDWLKEEPQEDDEKYLLQDEEGNFLYSFEEDHSQWLTKEPVNEATDPATVIAPFHEELAKVERDETISSNILVHEVYWQVDKAGRDNMQNTIDHALRNQLPVETQCNWILADNSIIETTYPELQAVLDAYTVRMGDIFNAYSLWRAGDKLDRFTFAQAEI